MADVPETLRFPFRSVLAVPADGGAVGCYRLLGPLQYVARAGVRCAATATVGTVDELLAADLIVVQRQHDPGLLALLIEARAAGRTVVYEIDDWLHELPPHNPVAALYPPGSPQLDGILALLRAANGVTVSTPELAEAYRAFNPNVHVLPLCIDFALRDWTTRPARAGERVVVGWSGGATHAEDLRPIAGAVRRALAAEPTLDFAIYSTPGLASWVARDWGLPPERLRVLPWREFTAYPAGLAEFDIGLAPLADSPFNRAKSNAKVLEYGAWATAAIASPVAPYARTIEHGVDGLFATDEDAWCDAILALARDPVRRTALGAALHSKVRRDYDLGKEWLRWPRAWAQIAAT